MTAPSPVDEYSRFLNYAVYAAVAAVVGWLIVRDVRRRRNRTGRDR